MGGLGMGDGVWGIGDGPQSPIPNPHPQSPIPIYVNKFFNNIFLNLNFNKFHKIITKQRINLLIFNNIFNYLLNQYWSINLLILYHFPLSR